MSDQKPDQKPSRGFSGALVKLWRGGDYEMTVTGRTELTPNYLRLHFDGKELLTGRALHPTMWVRAWFPDGTKSHQRGYTLVNADPAAGTVDIDFAMHDGLATRWASRATAGDTLEVTVLGSNFTLPEPAPAGYVIVGDAASLPAINSLLDAIAKASEATGGGIARASEATGGWHRHALQGLPRVRPRRRSRASGRHGRGDMGGPQEGRRGTGGGRRRIRVRRRRPLRLGGL
jgi:NADPH-dependent ferric siderophore reductase